MQILRQKGFASDLVSMDTTPIPYDVTKSAFYDRRINAPAHPKAIREFSQLERDPQTGKIDHPPRGSKDLADAIAGAVYGLTYRREIWLRHIVAIHIDSPAMPDANGRVVIVDSQSGLVKEFFR